MKKRILAAFVILCLLVSLMPGMTLPAAAAASARVG